MKLSLPCISIGSSLLALAVALVSPTPAAHANVITYTANLTGPGESPPNASPGTGFTTVITNEGANIVRRCDVQRLDRGDHGVTYPLLHPSSWSDRGCYYDTDICGFSLWDRSCNVLTSPAMAGWSIKRHPVSSTPRLMSSVVRCEIASAGWCTSGPPGSIMRICCHPGAGTSAGIGGAGLG